MAKTLFYKVTSLPAEVDSNSFYYVENGTFAEAWLTDGDAQLRSIGNSTMINSLIDQKITDLSTVDVVADIAERDALVLVTNDLILVVDASSDPQVVSGGALYVWDTQDTTFKLLATYQDITATLDWSNLLNGPSSSPADIDDAVSKRHEHSNLVKLEKVDETGLGLLMYGGVVVYDPTDKLISKTTIATLPGTLEANTVYYVTNGGKFDLYLSDDTGSSVSPLNASPSSSEIPTITDRISGYEGDDFYIGYNSDGVWEINKYLGTDINVKTEATQAINLAVTNLGDAWTNKLTLTYA